MVRALRWGGVGGAQRGLGGSGAISGVLPKTIYFPNTYLLKKIFILSQEISPEPPWGTSSTVYPPTPGPARAAPQRATIDHKSYLSTMYSGTGKPRCPSPRPTVHLESRSAARSANVDHKSYAARVPAKFYRTKARDPMAASEHPWTAKTVTTAANIF